MHKKLALGLAVSLCLQAAVAEDKPWNGQGELGFTQTTGNTETQSLVAKLGFGYKVLPWEHNIKLETLRSEDNSTLSAETYGLKWQSNYHWSDSSYLLGKFRYEEDRFSGYEYQSSLIFGYGHQLINTDSTGLKLEAGVGIGQNNILLDIYSETNDQQLIGYLGLNYRQKISDNTEFTQYLKVEGGTENVYSESDTGFLIGVMEHLKLKLSLLIKNNSEVPQGTEKTDTKSIVSLIYDF